MGTVAVGAPGGRTIRLLAAAAVLAVAAMLPAARAAGSPALGVRYR